MQSQVVIGGTDSVIGSTEIFPPPSSDGCTIPDLPERRAGLTLSLLSSWGTLVVCGGSSFYQPGGRIDYDSCLTWAEGSTSWTHWGTMRCPLILPNTLAIIHWFVDHQDIGTRLGHPPHLLIQLCCWVGWRPSRTSLTNQDFPSKKLKLCQVSVRLMYGSPVKAWLQDNLYVPG